MMKLLNLPRRQSIWPALIALTCTPIALYAQDPPPSSPPPAQEGNVMEQGPPGGNRVFGVLPNYRTADASLENTTLTTHQKFAIAYKDSFDYPLVLLSGALAGLSQWNDQNPSLGQGVTGFAHRLATNYADQAAGNMLAEAVFPTLFHQDPRYFRRGPSYGTAWQRARYALTRVILTKKDSGGTTFNYSEWIGNASATAISNAYYPDSRSAADNATKLIEQVGIDAVSQVLKEFWPDIQRKFFHKSSR